MNEIQNVNSSKYIKVESLSLIQNNISRMASNSALMKGFSATFLAALFGMAVESDMEWQYLMIAIVPIIGFISLDIYYLQLEKRYRNLYSLIIDGKLRRYNFELNLNAPIFENFQDEIKKGTSFFKILFSVSVWRFYIWFIGVAIALICLIA